MPSPICEVRDGGGPYQPTTYGVDVTPANVATIRLANQDDVDSWSISCLTTDELSDKDEINASLVINSATKTATFTVPGAFGRTFRFLSRINNGKDVNFIERADYATTFCIYLPTTTGHRTIAVDERLEGDPDFGWIVSFNEAVRTPPDGEANTASNVGGGAGVFQSKFGDDLRFRTIVGGQNMAVTELPSTIELGFVGVLPTANGGTGNADLVFPSGARTMVARDSSDVLTNKTIDSASNTITLDTGVLTSGVLGTVRGGTGNPNLTFPGGTRTMVARDSIDTLSNKTIDGGSNTVQNLNTSVLAAGTLVTDRGGTGLTAVNLLDNAGKLLGAGGGNIELVEPVMGLGETGHRLTCSSGVPVQIADLTTATTIYLTPHLHTFIHLWNGLYWQLCETGEVALPVGTKTANTNYDVFAYWTGSSVALEFGAAWTNNTTRSAALARRNGVLVLSSNHTRRYIGTVRTVSTTQVANWYNQRLVWNHYNRVRLGLLRQETVDSWTYATSVYRAANNNTANSVQFVSGEQTHLDLSVATVVSATVSGWGATVGLGFNSTTANNAHRYGGITNANMYNYCRAEYHAHVGIGFNQVYWTEISGGTTLTFYGDIGNGTFFQFGMLGDILG